MQRIAEVYFEMHPLTPEHLPRAQAMLNQLTRFLLFQENTDGLLLIADGASKVVHATLASAFLRDKTAAKLVAAGYVSTEEFYYNSSSCRVKFGYDRPQEDEERKRLRSLMLAALRNKGVIPTP